MLESNRGLDNFCDLGQVALSPDDRNRIIRDEHDSILTPIEKLQRTEVARRNADSMLSPTEKENDIVPTAQEKPEKRKRFFNFDIEDSFNQAKSKVKMKAETHSKDESSYGDKSYFPSRRSITKELDPISI